MFSADGDEVTDRLTDGSTDESDLWMERNFPRYWAFGKFHTGTLMGISTMNLADDWMDRTDDGCTAGWREFQVESHFS